jgi:hypothetical protein
MTAPHLDKYEADTSIRYRPAHPDRGGVEDENNHREPRTRSALISKFLVDQTFYDSDSATSFLDSGAFDSQRILGHHAMVLVKQNYRFSLLVSQ